MNTVEDYQRLAALEDDYWLARAQEALSSGYLTPEESEQVIQKALAPAKN